MKAKVLLVASNQEKKPWPVVPIGLCYVASALKNAGHQVKVVDLMFVRDCGKTLRDACKEFKPDIVGVSVRNVDNVDYQRPKFYLDRIRREVIEPLREAGVEKIMVGGPAVNTMPQEVVDCLDADAALYGDGELLAPSFVASWCAEGTRPQSPQIVWNSNRYSRQDEEPEAGRVVALGQVCSAAIHEWLDVRPYLRRGSPYSIQTKRGCVFRCSYCIYRKIEGSSYRLRDPEEIADEIETAYRDAGVWYFEFTDSVFNHPPEHAIAVCEAIRRRKLPISLNASGLNTKFLTPELIRAMEEAGFEEFSLSPETAAEAVLKRLGKGFDDVATLERAAQLAASSRLPVVWWFSFGLPGETQETVCETLNFIRTHLRPNDGAVATIGLRIFSGTELAEIARREMCWREEPDWLHQVFYQPPGISLEAIEEMVGEAAQDIPNIVVPSDVRKVKLMAIFIATGVTKVLFKHRRPVWFLVPRVKRWIRSCGLRW